MERRKFTREFKLEAVRLIKERGVSYVRALRPPCSTPTIARWRRRGGSAILSVENIRQHPLHDVAQAHLDLEGRLTVGSVILVPEKFLASDFVIARCLAQNAHAHVSMVRSSR